MLHHACTCPHMDPASNCTLPDGTQLHACHANFLVPNHLIKGVEKLKKAMGAFRKQEKAE